MDAKYVDDSTVSVIENDSGGDIEAISIQNGTAEDIYSEKEVIREIGSALIRLELDIAGCSEKLVNMNLLMMHVAARESNFEAFTLEKEDTLVGKALEFDILSGIFDLEVREMDRFIGTLETDLNNTCEVISSYEHLGEDFLALQEKLQDAEESIKQSQEQVSELVIQSTKFQKILSSINQGETSDEDKEAIISREGDYINTTAKLEMLTSQQHRHVLRMLEKSLARELELENELKECMQSRDEMKYKLHSSQLEVLSAEEETAAVYAQFLEADNASAVLLGISKDLMSRLQLCQFKINSGLYRETEMNTRLQECAKAVQKLEKEKAAMQELVAKNNLEALALKEKVRSLEEQLRESESALLNGNASLDEIKEFEERIFIVESRAQKAEAESQLLAEANKELNGKLDLLKNSGVSVQKVETLEKQLRETDIQLQEATASVEASQERQSLLYSSISDMEIVIEKLKSKLSEANAQIDSAEDRCIILSESHEELNEELNFFRSKVESLEASLQQAEETKLATAKDINLRSKVITDMVMQLAAERECLDRQVVRI
ncbi:WPP domain-interacting tail-anchored protein 1 isoform X2 [Beta vulgaris subsp. vulgaris]|uniref:WPP domain-interacting tail-anchored protein 1 isoform X2 n=1 Tax=Beta vulgaris subsp. vulgaris TaxID=3555 RepID=UPI00053FF4C4|nr:WPP domain-interacting tail-anchored protein 1 isoform X2 [Beta vulgaris subsp. vulgaris]